MEVSTVKQNCRDVAKRWKEQYPKDKADIYDKLVALKGEGTPEEIAIIIGNDSWTTVTCDECGGDVDGIVIVGEEENYDSRTASICMSCLQEAMAELVKALGNKKGAKKRNSSNPNDGIYIPIDQRDEDADSEMERRYESMGGG
jgi:hypothetical protein